MRHRRCDRSERPTRVSRRAAAGDDRRDRASRTGRRADPHRAGPGAGGAAAVDRRPRGRPPADLQRGRLDLGHPERRDLRVSRAPARAAGARAHAGHPVRHRALGPPLRGSRRGDVRQDPRPVRRRALGPQGADADPGPRPGGDLPAVLRRGRRLAALGLGDQGAARLGDGRGPARPQGHRPLLQHLLRGDVADVLRGDQDRSPRAITCGSATAGSSTKQYWDLDFPDAGPGAPAGRSRPRWSTSWST